MVGERSELTGREIVDVIEGGIDLYSSDDEKIGHVRELNPDFLIVDDDALDNDLYVPRSAVAREEGDRYYVNVSRDQISTMGWDQQLSTSGSTTDTTTADSTDYAAVEQDTTMERDTSYREATPVQTSDDTTRLKRHEEELQATKTVQEAGEVRVTKDVVEEMRTIEVPVTREEVRVERRPVSDSSATDTDKAFTGETISVPIHEEEVQVTKVPRAVEEIEIQKVTTQDTERVQDTVRKERFNVEGDETTQGASRTDQGGEMDRNLPIDVDVDRKGGVDVDRR